MSKKGKFMDVLDALSGSDASDSDSDADAVKAQGAEAGPSSKHEGKGATASHSEEEEDSPAKKPKKLESLTVADLERAGYKSGPSVLYVKPAQETGPSGWNWSNGQAAKQNEQDDDDESRVAMREALTTNLQASAEYSTKAMAHAAELREEARKERQRLEKEQRLSYNQKEKRKREMGQASRGGSYVEEQKRMGRALGMYSGFD